MKPFSLAFVDAMQFGLIAAVHLPGTRDPVPEAVLAQLAPEEREHARTLNGFRQVDWVGGRLALHRTIRNLGRRPSAVLVGPRGEPVLPEGLSVSVSHKRTLAVAIAARENHGTLGIDLEDQGPVRTGIEERVLRPEELEALASLDPQRRWMGVLLRFSIKEAIYKALHPYVNRWVDFTEASVTPDVDCQAEVTLHLARGEGPFHVEARYLWLEGRVLSVVRIRPAVVAKAKASPPAA